MSRYADKKTVAPCNWIGCSTVATKLLVVQGRLNWYCQEHGEELKGR